MGKKADYGPAAEKLYVETGRTIDEIAALLPVSRKTIGQWCKDDHWVRRKKARRTSPQAIIEKLDAAIDEMLSGAMDNKTADAVTKLQKTLERYKKESEAHFLDRAIEVMDRFIERLSRKYDDPERRQAFLDEIEGFFQELEAQAT